MGGSSPKVEENSAPEIKPEPNLITNEQKPEMSKKSKSDEMPQLTCIITGKMLSLSNKIHECKGCGGYAELDATDGINSCPRCRYQW